MTEETRADNYPATENQDAPMPSAEQETSESLASTEAVQREDVEVSDVGSQADDISLPAEVKDRTAEQFDKLKRNLAEERTRRMEYERYLSSLSLAQQQQQQQQKPLYDQTTGYVDVQELERMRTQTEAANKKAEKAQRELERFVQQQQEREAYEAYPDLNPSSRDFNDDLHKAVRAMVTDSILNPREYGGDELTMKAAADRLMGLSNKEVKKIAKEAKQEALTELTPKEQASLEASGRPDRRNEMPSESHQDLADRTRRGDLDAVIERLKGIPSV